MRRASQPAAPPDGLYPAVALVAHALSTPWPAVLDMEVAEFRAAAAEARRIVRALRG